jgi:proteasome beta subunit
MDSAASEEMKKAIHTGTTTVGLVGADGIVFAADKRATMGTFIASKDIDKIYMIDDHIGITIAGSVGDAQMLIRWLRVEMVKYRQENEKKISVEAAATLLANILSSNKYFPFWIQIIMGGCDEKPRLFSIDMVGGVTEESKTSTGSGSPIAFGVIDTNFKKGMKIDDLIPIAVKSVWAAMGRDAATGEFIDVTTITKGGHKKLPKDEIEKLIKLF